MIVFFAPRPYEFHYELPIIKKTGGLLLTTSPWVGGKAEQNKIEWMYGGLKELQKYNNRENKIILARHIRRLPQKAKCIQIFHGLIEKNYTYEKIHFKSQYSIFFWISYLLENSPIKKLSPLNKESPFHFIENKMRDRYELICVPGPYAERKLDENGLLKEGKWIRAGVPKLDKLKRGKAKNEILYAPTWGKLSSIPYSLKIFEIAREYGIDIVFKPHPLVIEYNQFSNILKKLSIYDAIFVDAYEDATKYMPSSLALITDYSSVGVEYLAIDRPIILLHFKEAKGKAEKLLRKAAEVIKKPEQIEKAIEKIIDGKDEKKKEREELRKLFFYSLDGKASDRVAEAILKL